MENAKKYCIVDACGFSFDKDGELIKYYQIVIMTDYGYKVKKTTDTLYRNIRDNELCPFFVDGLLYDEYGRVCDIQKQRKE